MKQTLVLHEPVQAWKALNTILWPAIKGWLVCNGSRLRLDVKLETRTTAQNARLWALLGEVSDQVNWHGRKLSPEEWKHVFTAALKRQDVVPGLEGGFVVLGQSTSKMTRAEMADLQTLIEAFGAQHGVKFSAPEGWDH